MPKWKNDAVHRIEESPDYLAYSLVGTASERGTSREVAQCLPTRLTVLSRCLLDYGQFVLNPNKGRVADHTEIGLM